MSQPAITLTVGGTVLSLSPDLLWADEFDWFSTEQTVERSVTGALIIDLGTRLAGRPITLEPPDEESAWMPRATLTQLQAWEATPNLTLTLSLRGIDHSVIFRRFDGAPLKATPVVFVADPTVNGFGDAYLTTLRFIEV